MFSIILTFHYFFMNKFKKNSTYSFVTLYNSSLLLLINWMHPWLIKALLIPNVWTILYITAFTVNECLTLQFATFIQIQELNSSFSWHHDNIPNSPPWLHHKPKRLWEVWLDLLLLTQGHTQFFSYFFSFFFWLPSTLPRAHRPQPGPFHIFE